ncbi:MAG TPA: pentapeptide repeat-containing protein [Ktedonobacterales bacterium]
MSDEVPQRPTSNDDSEGWKAYWAAQGMPWRTEPEIEAERQRFLAEKQASGPGFDRHPYPLDGTKLGRADVEWLLATHQREGFQGPIEWRDERQRGEAGAGMADEPKSEQPAETKPTPDDSEPTPERQAELQAAYEANVAAGKAPYAGVEIRTRGELRWVMQERRWSSEVELPEGYERAILSGANLRDASLSGADLRGANLSSARLRGANLSAALLSGANLNSADLRGTNLSGTRLGGANLSGARLGGANLSAALVGGANLSGVDLRDANLSGTRLGGANLSGVDLRGARMNVETGLARATFSTTTRLADVIWNDAPLARVVWEELPRVGDEAAARQRVDADGKKKDVATRRSEYEAAVRAYRLLAVELRSQGLNEHSDRYANRAQLCERRLLRMQRHYLRYLGSLLLDLISGYGYRPLRSIATYVLVILAFAGAYLLNAQFAEPHLRWDEAIVLSISAFHGRGFFTTGISLGDTLARLAAAEAIIGLLIEITFIATFTQRFFAR